MDAQPFSFPFDNKYGGHRMACWDGHNELEDNSVGEPKTHMIRKGGYFYRPDFAGYTEAIEQAGLFTKTEAESHAAGAREVTAVPAVEAMCLFGMTPGKLSATISRLITLQNLLADFEKANAQQGSF